jgi:aspartyl-tRNA(Asn)/glutamyl-tRNA(Gln) amidotransferase subunit C
MSDPITPETFAHLVDLAALALTPQEGEYLLRELNNQLKAINELAAIPLDPATPIASHGVPYTAANSQAPRPDEWLPFPNPDAILKQAPQLDERYIVVPETPHTTLE